MTAGPASPLLDRDWIAAHLPHQGSMCLLDAVTSWDAGAVCCRTRSHRDPRHPLRAHGRLGSACAIEYAAQAAAIHGALTAPRGATFGMLSSARAVELHVERLDEVLGELLIQTRRLHSDDLSALYVFSVHEQAAPPRLLAQGRVTLWLAR